MVATYIITIRGRKYPNNSEVVNYLSKLRLPSPSSSDSGDIFDSDTWHKKNLTIPFKESLDELTYS